MPYKSEAQRNWAHTKEGTEALGGPAKVQEWDEASKGHQLPDRIGKPHKANKRASVPQEAKIGAFKPRSSGVKWMKPKGWG